MGDIKVVSFKSADELKQKYVVYANFYKMEQANGKVHLCRNVADIYDINYKDLKSNSRPQALIIMMNPGKCQPKNKNYKVQSVTIEKLHEVSKKEPNVLCVPDNAQYQIMRIMYAKNWSHMRIVNLSDIRCSNGDEFKLMLKELLTIDNLNLHSIFSTKRSDEKNNLLLLEADAPVIFGWGTDKLLISLAKECEKCFLEGRGKGVKYDENLYYYPSPPLKTGKEDWLNKILKIV